MIEVIDRLRSLFVRGEVPLQQPPPVQPIDVNACIRAVLELEGSYLMAHGVSFSAWAGFDSAGPLTRHSSKRLMTPSSDMRCLDRLRKLHTVESFAVAKAKFGARTSLEELVVVVARGLQQPKTGGTPSNAADSQR